LNRQMLGGEYLKKVTRGTMRKATEATAISPEAVAETIISAILASHPSPTYWVGWFSKFIALPLSVFPAFLADFLLVYGNRFLFGIKPTHVSAMKP